MNPPFYWLKICDPHCLQPPTPLLNYVQSLRTVFSYKENMEQVAFLRQILIYFLLPFANLDKTVTFLFRSFLYIFLEFYR